MPGRKVKNKPLYILLKGIEIEKKKEKQKEMKNDKLGIF